MAKGSSIAERSRRGGADDYPVFRISQVVIFPSTADSPDTVGTAAPYPAGSDSDPAVVDAWATQAGDLTAADIVDTMVGTEFSATDVASMKARLSAYRSIAVTEDPASALAVAEDGGTFYASMPDGSHKMITAVGYVDGEGLQVLSGTLQTGDTFYVYMQVVVEPVS